VRTRRLPNAILANTAHRPWPLPTGSWIQRQSWNDFLFCHWPVEVGPLRERVPPQLELELWEGQAWLGIIPFHMSGVTLRGLPDLPGFSAFPELNVRTYVRVGEHRGVYFLSLEAHNALAVAIARRWYGLPYMLAEMDWHREGDHVVYRSHRIHRGAPPADYSARYAPVGEPWLAVPSTFEHWLTERYALFVVDGTGRIWRGDVHHEPWPLRHAEVQIEVNTLPASHGLALADTAPVALYSPGVDVVVWRPVQV
jgi:uncharacterized protein YqjF (DUF2071 family)